jgi:Zn-dependent protease with chaperone function
MKNRTAFTGRILLALLLMICFYTLAISLAGFLIFIPIGMVVFLHRFQIHIGIASFVGGCMILWSVLPRWDRFVAPGPRLTEKDQPELFKQLQSIAQSTEQSMPAEVYALPEMNAWVANRGGIMGIGSRRIMGIGIPLMQVLSTQQLRGVLAHEFGHYYGGDTKLGPWLYITRSAIMRTVINLASNGSSILLIPFKWYLRLFLALTQKVSRQQEFTADALAAKIVGPEAIGEALKAVHSKALAFDGFWQNEYSPALELGVRPPMAEGFREYSDAPRVREAVDAALKKALEESKSDIYDSHPALKERLQAIQKVAGPRQPAIDPPAIHWIRDVDGIERQMIDHIAQALNVNSPKAVQWSETAEIVLLPNLYGTIQQLGGNFNGMTFGRAVEKLGNQADFTELLSQRFLSEVDDFDTRRIYAARIIGTLSLLAFNKQGWNLENPIGQPPYVTKSDVQDSVVRLDPVEWIDRYIERKCTIDELLAKYQEFQIEGVELDQLLVKRA